MAKEFTPKEIAEKVAKEQAWAERAILRLYQEQTPSEQQSDCTIYHNGRGFNGVDAEILSSFARRIEWGRPLTPKQLAIAHKRLPKYAKQLHRLAYGER